MFGDFHATVLADGDEAFVVQERLGSGFFLSDDDVFEQDVVLQLDRHGPAGIRMVYRHVALDCRDDSDALRQIGCGPQEGWQGEEQPCHKAPYEALPKSPLSSSSHGGLLLAHGQNHY
jgi:hypothetical protein